MKAIIIGRGPSCLKCTKEFVYSHDLIAVTNKFIFRGYEKYVGSRADIQFRNGSTTPFTPCDLKKLGLKELVYTNKNRKFGRIPKYYKDIKITRPSPPLKVEMAEESPYDHSTGIVAVYYMLKTYDLSELSIVGLDFYETGRPPFYFAPKDVDRGLRYNFRDMWKDNIVHSSNWHDSAGSAEYIKTLMRRNSDVTFNLITHSSLFNDFNELNVRKGI